MLAIFFKICYIIPYKKLNKRVCSSDGLERSTDNRKVGGSIPPRPTQILL